MGPAPVEEGPKNTARRDLLLQLQSDSQTKWTDTKVFEVDAPANVASSPDNKFFGNFPYPYMNGMLHLGHAFSLSKLEFAAAYQRMQGKHTLFPFAFHCTGMPIKAAADKLDRECNTYGCPPVFPAPVEESEEPAPKEEAKGPTDPTKFKGKKTKAASKSGGQMYQWEILKSSGIPEGELASFRKAEHWLEYFPPLGKRDVAAMGCQVDWRRSFITTDYNPYYDAFIRWHLNSLRKHNKVVRDKRFSVYSPLDGQPCADHDRASGEGVGPQDYVLIKMKALEYPGKLAALKGKKVYLCAATLRAETMYGQTNFWVLPDGDYGAYEMANGDVYVVTPRAARNLSFQEHCKEYGKLNCLVDGLKGWDLIGLPVSAPNAFNKVIYGLPMMNVLTSKGTGVVTSVPSDAPDDYMALQDLKKKPALREKYGVKDEWVMPFEVIPIINIPEFGDQSAVKVCEDLKIQSQNDRAKLDEAKNRTYLKGFYEGVMLVGNHKGETVQIAKPAIRDEMVASGDAIIYSEPEKMVMSRSGDECVVALTDQWYLTYGEEQWQAQAKAHLENMETYSPDTKKAFREALDWLKQWALSRNFGLGTRLPWDPVFLIESLSDSTIYMAYYTIAHILQGGDMYGGVKGRPIKPESMTDEVFDHIFLDGPAPKTDIPADLLVKMKQEFNFWYPYDLRVSGKDLIQNHLSFSIYNHTAIFPEKHWPRSFRCNGHLMLNSEKMAKSTGNFLTLKQAIEEFSADAMRIALADAGDSLEDANFVDKTANASILRLTKELTWIEETLAPGSGLRQGPADTYADRVFKASIAVAIDTTTKHYNDMNFREALKYGWYDLQTARDIYRLSCGGETDMNLDLVKYFIEVQTLMMTPICPHTMEHIWTKLLKRDGCAVAAPFPKVSLTDADLNLVMAGLYLQEEISTTRNLIAKQETPKKAKKGQPVEPVGKVTGATLYVAKEFTGWHAVCLSVLREKFDTKAKEWAKDTEAGVLAALAKSPEAANVQGGEKMLKKLAMPFVQYKKTEAINVGPHVLETCLPFDEKACLVDNAEMICRALNIQSFTVHYHDSAEAQAAPESAKVSTALPGTPAHSFELVAGAAPPAKEKKEKAPKAGAPKQNKNLIFPTKSGQEAGRWCPDGQGNGTHIK
mmetsp:Transcript_13147/g.15928  ORF Transcript_13147/g.15928 Transcript_13147/m.15928 type:complete len:1141 (-) Transcript_13147:440-3862(-)|eukprot:CAMPEP_0197858824 /NCGR_PEP_ID=MMETSP1438-20131217/32925_1 /TAXON_ID=1461541 /ORGANISM="Pterosperma sp., Strain CCMP1384" /LENGTH=1140 /DNA_ID=CAMNT_0043475105 /DNA_START=123 /DNA_END=3545 /DNA_ORIENTATION=+